MLMRSTSKLIYAAGIAAAIALTASAANAQASRMIRGGYEGAYGYSGNVPSAGRDFVYGANRAPYGADVDEPRDFQLQGTH
jgi:uncharacterized membrane protein